MVVNVCVRRLKSVIQVPNKTRKSNKLNPKKNEDRKIRSPKVNETEKQIFNRQQP